MCLAFYSCKSENEGKRLMAQIRDSIPGQKIKIFRSVETLAGSLANSPSPDIAVLLVADEAELLSVLSLKKSLEDSRIIMILPDRTEENLKRSYPLNPLLTCFRDGGFSETVALMARMKNESLAEADQENPSIYRWSQGFPFVHAY